MDQQTQTSTRRSWQVLAVLLVGAFMALLDVTIVNVALPSMMVGLHASDGMLEWVVAGYALAFGLALIPAGRLGDNRGHHIPFVFGLTLFTLASFACGIAQTPLELVIARVAQGLGAGMFNPPITAIIHRIFNDKDRGKAFGILGAAIGLSTALGPLLGGVLVRIGGVHSGWRWIFMVNVPIGLVLLPVAAKLLPRHKSQWRKPADVFGMVLLGVSLLLLLLPLVEGQSAGWPAWTWQCAVAGIIGLGALVVWGKRLEAMGMQPYLAIQLLRQPVFAAGLILMFVYFAAFTSIFFTLSILWQVGLSHSALETGLVIVPFALTTMVAAGVSHKLAARFGRRVLVMGSALLCVGFLLTLALLYTQGEHIHGWQLIVPLLLAGTGNGLFIAPSQNFIFAAVPHQEAGDASGMLNTAQRVGSAFGVAIIGTILFGTLQVVNYRASFVHSAVLATAMNTILAMVACGLVFTLPKRIKQLW